MNRGARKLAIYPDGASCSAFLELLSELPERFGVRVHAYALMPNHFHLMIESVKGNLSRALQFLQSRYSQWLNSRYEWDGPLFKGRFRNRVVEEDAWWMHLLVYLHLNPVRAHLATSAEAADWTSHGEYIGLARCPRWLTTLELLEYYGTVDRYLEHLRNIQMGRDEAPVGFEKIALEPGPFRSPKSTAPESRTQSVWPLERALAAAMHVTGASLDDLRDGRVGRSGNPRRWIALWWLNEVTALSQTEIGRELKAAPATVCRSIRKVRERQRQDVAIATWVEKLENLR